MAAVDRGLLRLGNGRLTIPSWMARDIGIVAAENTKPTIREDLKLIGLQAITLEAKAAQGKPAQEDIHERHADMVRDAMTNHSLDRAIAVHVNDEDTRDPDISDLMIDPISAAVLTAYGVSIPVVALLARSHDDLCAEPDGESLFDLDMSIETYKGQIGIHVAIGDGWSTTGQGIKMPQSLPETIAIAAAGRPLASIMSHPLTDDLGLVIDRIEGDMIRFDESYLKRVFD